MIREVLNGKASATPNVCYCVQNGKTLPGKKVYLVSGGKNRLTWQEKGTKDNPYKIYTPEDLLLIRKYPDKCFVLMKGINIKSNPEDYLPLLWDRPFTGILDGQGYWISADRFEVPKQKFIIYNTPDGSNAAESGKPTGGGLFAENRGIITRLRSIPVADLSDLGNSYSYGGMFVGINYGIIDSVGDVSFRDTVKHSEIAGIAGVNCGTIQNSFVTLLGDYTCRIGISGVNWGTIQNCRVWITKCVNGMSAIAEKTMESSIINNCSFRVDSTNSATAPAVRKNLGGVITNTNKLDRSDFSTADVDYSTKIY